jgi:hypothetical protein
MVQAIENLTALSGRVLTRSRHPTLGDYDLVTLAVERAEPVPGRANLLSSEVGKELSVAIRRELLGDAKQGDHLRCRAKRTPAGAMCEPRPDPADFAVTAS